MRALEAPHLGPLIQLLLFMEGFSSPSLAKTMSLPTSHGGATLTQQPHGRQEMNFPWTQLPSDMSSAVPISSKMNS